MKYPNGYSTCLPAIRYPDGSMKYLKEPTNVKVTLEVQIVALGRYELVHSLSDAEIVESIEGGGSLTPDDWNSEGDKKWRRCFATRAVGENSTFTAQYLKYLNRVW